MPFITPDHRDRAIGEIKLFFSDPNSTHCVQLTILCAQINTSEPHHVCPRFYGQLALLLIRAVIKRDTLVSPLIICNNLELVLCIRHKAESK